MSSNTDHTFKTKVVGITQGDRQRLLSTLGRSESMRLAKAPGHAPNSETLAVFVGDRELGLLKKEVSKVLLPLMDQGIELKVWLESVLKAREGHLDCFVEIFYRGPAVDVPGLRTRTKVAKSEEAPGGDRRRFRSLIFWLLCIAAAAVLGRLLMG